jgi:hypothetical protein
VPSAALLLAFSLGLPAGRAFPRTFSLLFWAQLVLLTSTLALLVAWSVAFGATAITGLVVPLAAEMAAVGLVGRTRAELAHARGDDGQPVPPANGWPGANARGPGGSSTVDRRGWPAPGRRRSGVASSRPSATCSTRSNW